MGMARSPMPMPSAAPPVSAPSPQMAQGGGGLAPSPQPAAASPLPRGAPMTPSGGQTLGGQANPAAPITASSLSAPSQQQLQPPPQQQTSQLSPTLQQQQQDQQSNLDQFKGQFDLRTMAQNLVKQPNMTPQRLGKIFSSPALRQMLNAEGLQQYRMLGLDIREQNARTSQDRLTQQAYEFAKRQGNLQDWRGKLLDSRQTLVSSKATFDMIKQDASSKLAAISQSRTLGEMTAEQADKATEKVRADRDQAIGDAIKKMHETMVPGEDDESGGGGGGGGDKLLEQAKAAIMRGAPKDAVLKRLKEVDPQADLSGLQ